MRASGDIVGGAGGHRRTLALLAILAVAGDAGLSRDKIVSLLWPDSDTERARHSLTQALYSTRRSLKADDLFVSAADIRLNPDRITSDVQEFVAAIEARDLETAVALYSGPFLDGFFFSGSADFERWVTTERDRLQHYALDALEQLAAGAEESGDFRQAVDWRKRQVALAPLDSGLVVKLMHAMARGGDRAGAIHQAQLHAEALREQLELEPDPVVESLAETLRDPVEWVPAESVELARATNADEPDATSPVISSAPVAVGARRSVGVWIPARARRPWRAIVVVAVAVVSLVAIGALLEHARRSKATIGPLAVPQRVVVAPFRVAGAAPSLAYLRDGMVELLATRLADDTAARAVDAGAVLGAWRAARLSAAMDVSRDTIVKLAARLGAEQVVVGSVVGSPSRLVITASLLSVPAGASMAAATSAGPSDSLTALIDRLAARLLVAEAGEGERLASYTSRSLPALRAFLLGQREFRGGDYPAAVVRYDLALRRDSSFALAALYKAMATDRLSDDVGMRSAVALAEGARESLTERDEVLLTAIAGPRYPAPSTSVEQIAAWQRLVDVAPTSPEAWTTLAARVLHDGRAAGVANAMTRVRSALQRALALGPDYMQARLLMARLPSSAGTDTARAGSDQPVPAHVAVVAAQFDGVHLASVAESLAARRASGSTAQRFAVALDEHAVALLRGRPADALAATERLRRLRPGSHEWLRLRVLDGVYADGDSVAAEEAAAHLATLTGTDPTRVPTSSDSWLADACALAQWRLAHEDTTAVAAIVETLDARTMTTAPPNVSSSPVACAVVLRTWLAVVTRRGDARARVRQLDSLVFTPQVAGDLAASAPLVLARLHERLGDPGRAFAALQRRPYRNGPARYLAAVWLEEGRLAERLGNMAGAHDAYTRYLTVRDDPEPPRRDAVARVRARLAALDPNG